jgi:Tfp pilus assembly protein PilN
MLVVLFASLLLAWGTLSWIQIGTFTEIQELKNDINQKEAELYRYRTQSAEVVKLQERYQVIEQLLADHIYWSKFFVLLEKYTLPNVYYTSFSVKSEPGARITLNARGRNVDAIAQQLKALQDAPDFADAVDINGFSMVSQSQRGVTRGQGSEEVSFDITLTLNKDVFRIE